MAVVLGKAIESLGDKVDSKLLKESIYKIYYNEDENKALNFTLQSCSISENAEAPTFPVDSNTTIGDNIIIGNISVSLNIFVDYEELESFETAAKEGNLSDKGFTIKTISKTFTNMRWVNKSYSEDFTALNGVFIQIDFLEIKIVEAKTGVLNYKSVKKASYASTQQNGKVQTKAKDKSIAYKLLME